MKTRRKWSLALRSGGQRGRMLANLNETFSNLANDLSHVDLGQQLRLYKLTGDREDPVVELAGMMPTNYSLLASLQAAYDNQALPITPDIHGLVLAGSAVRHLTFQEYRERAPEDFNRVLARVREEAEIDAKDQKRFDKKAIVQMEKYYTTQIVPSLPPPPMMPEKLKMRALVITVLMREGFNMVIHTDTPEANVVALPEEAIYETAEFSALWQFLHGVRPEAANAQERVNDAKVFAAQMAGLNFDFGDEPQAEN